MKEFRAFLETFQSDMEVEFTDAQLDRIDEIYSAVFDLCKVMTERDDLEWNMSFIGDIADCAETILTRNGYSVRYPAIVEEPDGTQKVVDYDDGLPKGPIERKNPVKEI